MATTPKAEPVSPPCSWDREGSFLQESSEGAGCDPERPFSEAAPLCPRLSCSAGPPPCSETLCQDGVQPPPVSDATQALFWASILQAQRCVLDLEGEIHRQREPVERELPGTPKPWPSEASPEPLLLESDSEEDSVERQEEEEESKEEEEEGDEEEEMEHLFYNNPLWGCSSRGATCDRDGLALWSCSEGDASVEREEGVATALSGSSPVPCSLGCQVRVASSPVPRTSFSEPEWDAASPVPAYVSHHRSSSPLVITEGDAEGFFSSTGNLEVPGGVLDQLDHSPPGSGLESVDPGPSPGAAVPGDGLLFSASSMSLVSALLHEPRESRHLPRPPLSAESQQAPSSARVFSALAAEQRLWQEDIRLPDPPSDCSSPPSCTWVEEPDTVSCPEEEVVAQDLLSSALGGAAGRLESSQESLEMPEVPSAHGRDEILAAEEEEEEEEELLTMHCPKEEPPLGPSRMEETQRFGEQPDPHGAGLPPQFLANGTYGDQAAAHRLATRLYHLDGFKRSQVASFLRKNNEFSQMVAEAFLSFFDFSGQTLDQALRSFLKAFVLTGETQERERILRHFSQRYHDCNLEVFRSSDAVHTLTCALMLLNTDLHGQNIGRSMTCPEFLTNLEGLNEGQNFPKELLKALYYSIRHDKLEWAMDEEEAPGPPATTQPTALTNALYLRKNNNPFLTLSHDPAAQIYRQGPLARKVHAEVDGKKTPWGKRGWKVFHTVLKGVVLYFFKDESRPDVLSSEEPIGVHHALAEKACKYTKRPHVFRLQTADWRIVLFQASTPEEMNSWISRINLVAAMFSSPPFPAAVGSQRRFIRPILPTAPSKSSLEDQHQAHERWADQMADELLEHQRNLPDKHGRARDLEEYRLKKEYLLYEKRRYETYVRLLEVKLGCATDDLGQWEAQLGEAEESPGLKKSHSSPSLNADGPLGGIKVKRNISERRTVRKIIPRRNKHLL